MLITGEVTTEMYYAFSLYFLNEHNTDMPLDFGELQYTTLKNVKKILSGQMDRKELEGWVENNKNDLSDKIVYRINLSKKLTLMIVDRLQGIFDEKGEKNE